MIPRYIFIGGLLSLMCWGCKDEKPASKLSASSAAPVVATPPPVHTEIASPAVPVASIPPASTDTALTTNVLPTTVDVATIQDCSLLGQWFKDDCDSIGTRFACNGTEEFIKDEDHGAGTDQEWCTGVGYLRVKPLYKQVFTEAGQTKLLMLVGMMPEVKWNDTKFSETLLGASIWTRQGKEWRIQHETKMITFLQSNIRKPMKFNYLASKRQLEVQYKEGKTDQTLRIGLVKSQFKPLEVGN